MFIRASIYSPPFAAAFKVAPPPPLSVAVFPCVVVVAVFFPLLLFFFANVFRNLFLDTCKASVCTLHA